MHYNMRGNEQNKTGVHLKLLMGEVSRLVCASEYPFIRTFLPNGCIRMLKVLFRVFNFFLVSLSTFPFVLHFSCPWPLASDPNPIHLSDPLPYHYQRIGKSISKMWRNENFWPRSAMLTDVDIVVGQPHGIKSDSPQDILYLIYSVTAVGFRPSICLSLFRRYLTSLSLCTRFVLIRVYVHIIPTILCCESAFNKVQCGYENERGGDGLVDFHFLDVPASLFLFVLAKRSEINF